MVQQERFELSAFSLATRCSTVELQLHEMVLTTGIEPVSTDLQSAAITISAKSALKLTRICQTGFEEPRIITRWVRCINGGIRWDRTSFILHAPVTKP